MTDASEPLSLVKSKQRVADHGEVFTPAWLVEDMLDLVKHETERIDSRFLEPACGSGNFLVPVFAASCDGPAEVRKSDFEKRHQRSSLMCVYGIELLADNAAECRQNLLDMLFGYLGPGSVTNGSLPHMVVAANIVQGDALAMTTPDGRAHYVPRVGLPRPWQVPAPGLPIRAPRPERSSIQARVRGPEEHDVFRPPRTTRP